MWQCGGEGLQRLGDLHYLSVDILLVECWVFFWTWQSRSEHSTFLPAASRQQNNTHCSSSFCWLTPIKQKSLTLLWGLVIKDRQRLTLPGFILVPSALVGLTSLFGPDTYREGRGDPYCPIAQHHFKVFHRLKTKKAFKISQEGF